MILTFTEDLLKLKFLKMCLLVHIIGRSRRYTSFRHGWIQGHKVSLGLKSPSVGSASSALAPCVCGGGGGLLVLAFHLPKLSNPSKECFSSSTVQLSLTAVTSIT